MTQKERDQVTDKILKYCRETQGIWAVKIHADAIQGTGLPDIVGCCGGLFWACECKTPTGRTTKLQRHTLDLIQKSGGLAIVARSLDEFKEALYGNDNRRKTEEGDGRAEDSPGP